MKTSINNKACKVESSERHNTRRKDLDYVRSDLSHLNESLMLVQDLAAHQKQLAKLVKDKTGRAMQAKATPIRESVVLIKADTTMAEIQRLAELIERQCGAKLLQIHIHKDEGHYAAASGEWVPNHHAHMVFDWIDHATGKSVKTTKAQASEWQTFAAQCLGMERGVASDRKHLDALRYKAHAVAKECADLEQQRIDKKSALDKENGSEIKANVAAITGRVADLVGVGKVAEAKRRIKELEKAAKGEPQRTERAVKAAVAQIEQKYAQEVESWKNAAKCAQNERDAALRSLDAANAAAAKLRLVSAIHDYARYYFHRALAYVFELAERKPVWIGGKLEFTHKDGSPWMSCDMGDRGVTLSWDDNVGLLIEGQYAEQFVRERASFHPSQSEGWKR